MLVAPLTVGVLAVSSCIFVETVKIRCIIIAWNISHSWIGLRAMIGETGASVSPSTCLGICMMLTALLLVGVSRRWSPRTLCGCRLSPSALIVHWAICGYAPVQLIVVRFAATWSCSIGLTLALDRHRCWSDLVFWLKSFLLRL
jgi:hypothetical protein